MRILGALRFFRLTTGGAGGGGEAVGFLKYKKIAFMPVTENRHKKKIQATQNNPRKKDFAIFYNYLLFMLAREISAKCFQNVIICSITVKTERYSNV